MSRATRCCGWLLALGLACACGEDESLVGRVVTVDGPLECDAVRERIDDRVDELAAERSACEVDADCACAYVDLACGEQCHVAIRAGDASAFESGLDAISDDYCGDARFPTVCGVAVPSCRACTAVCVSERCQRAPYVTDASAP